MEDVLSLSVSVGAQVPQNYDDVWLFPPLFPPPGRKEPTRQPQTLQLMSSGSHVPPVFEVLQELCRELCL